MVDLRLVGDGEKITLLRSYDLSQRFRLWQDFQQEHEKFINRGMDSVGRDSFTNYIVLKISDYQHEVGQIFDPTTNDNEFDTDTIEAKTVYNFLAKSLQELVRVYNGTFRIIDAYLSVVEGVRGRAYYRPSFLETLGATTALQFSPPNSTAENVEQFLSVGSSAERLFLFDASTSMLPAPLQAKCVLIWLQKVTAEKFLLVKLVPLPRELEHADTRFSSFDKSDWNEDHYSGIAIPTRDGLSCHLTSMNAKIPLYTLIKSNSEHALSCAFVSYETPGYLLDYLPLSVLNNNNIVKYFENSPWIV